MRDTNHRKMDVEINDEIVGAAAKDVPDSLDWRTKGFVTSPVNQKTCGSCYAFSISYAITGQIMQRIGRLEFVSQQQLVDCSVETGNQVGSQIDYVAKFKLINQLLFFRAVPVGRYGTPSNIWRNVVESCDRSTIRTLLR